MPRTIDEGFRDFLSKLTASESETTAAKSHRESIERRLDRDFGLLRFFRIGSFGNGTSISGYSDVDYLASLDHGFFGASSTYSLSKVRESLAERFPFTDVRVSCPAVRLAFAGGPSETHEIVPGDLASEEDGFMVYRIADCSGSWMKASPEAHIAYVNNANKRLGKKVKPLIRFVKAWKYFRDVPISSFYLEMRAAKYSTSESSIVYSIDVKRILCDLWDHQLAAIRDPMGVSGNIPACKSAAAREDALSKLETARARATKACSAESEGRISDAFYWWRLLYNDEFPTYNR